MNHKKSIIVLAILVAVISAVTGFRYYHYMNNDPSFCSLCHLTEEGYRSWERSEHHLIKCQTCHRISILEGNKLLLAYVGGATSIEQEHGRSYPWETCRSCHDSESAQGSVTFRKSYGHARHVFMQGIECSKCHGSTLHDLSVDSSKCSICHSDKLVHGMGTAGLACLNCHVFTESKHNMTSSERCFNCHSQISRTGIMSQIECHDCHHPHKKLKFESSDCLGACHSSEVKVGQHRIHMVSKNMDCIDCHRPHEWSVTKKNAIGLCGRCHKLKDPISFIY